MNFNIIEIVKTVLKKLFKTSIDEVLVKEIVKEDTVVKGTYAKLAEELIDENIKEALTKAEKKKPDATEQS